MHAPPPLASAAPMDGAYLLPLVVFSVGIAVFASYTALNLAGRVAAAGGRTRRVWLAGGSVAMGTGIWSMHFVGMLAFRLPVPMAYEVTLWLLSMVVAVLASFLALWVVGRERVSPPLLALAALCMGAAIAGMHYLGMAALRIPGHVTYDPVRVAASVAIAVVASFGALWLALRFRHDPGRRVRAGKVASAGVMGIAIAGMHYTAMSAARFHRAPGPLRLEGGALLATAGLAVSVVLATAVVLGLALAGAALDRRLRRRAGEVRALRESEARFRTVFSDAPIGMALVELDGRVSAANHALAGMLGYAPEALAGRSVDDLTHPDDREEDHRLFGELLAGTRDSYQLEKRFLDREGGVVWGEVTASLVRGEDGAPLYAVGMVEDITAWRRQEEEREFLAEASRVLASSLDYDATLAAVTRLAVPRIADWCAVDELAPDGSIRRIAVAHPAPEMVELAVRVQERLSPAPDDPAGVPRVVRTGEPEVMAQVPESLLQTAALDDDHRQLLHGIRSYMIVPLRTRDRTVGALTLVSTAPGRRYGERDLALAEELARRAAVAIENARLFREVEEARENAEEQALELETQAAELQEAQAETELANNELLRANRDLEARTREAERARHAADEANAAKSAFLATMSHELRTPLNAIGGYAELMEMGIRGPLTEKQRGDLAKIRRSQQRLLGLINDVLNFARIEAGEVRYRTEEVPLDEVLAGMEALIHPQAAARGLEYEYRPQDPELKVCADRERLEQVVLNLLGNAIKFTRPGGRVVLDSIAGEHEVRIRVTDTGIGIPADRLHDIFEPFVQVDASLTRETEGTGLGLAISRDLARAMGGELTADSTEGEGSTFTLRLPRAVPAEVRASA